MEDAHSIEVPFGGIRGQGFFAIFDGHAGKQAAEWCGVNFAPVRQFRTCMRTPDTDMQLHFQFLLRELQKDKKAQIPDVFNQTYHDVDKFLSKLCEESQGRMHSGCTVVTAFLRLEDPEGHQSFLPPGFDMTAYLDEPPSLEDDTDTVDGVDDPDDERKPKKSGRLRNALRNLGAGASSGAGPDATLHGTNGFNDDDVFTPPPAAQVRRVLYCANAGDARGVLCRRGRAVRLTYDHKGSDKQEAKRIMDAGGFVMSGRVNGVLNVTRSLGDSSMKEFVVGAPYTTETELSEEDEFLILACDGVRTWIQRLALASVYILYADENDSCGTSSTTKPRSSSSAQYQIPGRWRKSYSIMHTAIIRQTTSRSSSCDSGIRRRACAGRLDDVHTHGAWLFI